MPLLASTISLNWPEKDKPRKAKKTREWKQDQFNKMSRRRKIHMPMTRGTDWMRLTSSLARINSRLRLFCSSLMYSSWGEERTGEQRWRESDDGLILCQIQKRANLYITEFELSFQIFETCVALVLSNRITEEEHATQKHEWAKYRERQCKETRRNQTLFKIVRCKLKKTRKTRHREQCNEEGKEGKETKRIRTEEKPKAKKDKEGREENWKEE